MKTTKQEIINEAKKRVSEIAKATKALWQNDQYRIVLMWNSSKNEYTVSQVQMGWMVENEHIYFGNYPMTKKEVVRIIEEVEFQESLI